MKPHLLTLILVWAASSLAAQVPTITPTFTNNQMVDVYNYIKFDSNGPLFGSLGEQLTDSTTIAPYVRLRLNSAVGDSIPINPTISGDAITVAPDSGIYLDWNATYYVWLDSLKGSSITTAPYSDPITITYRTRPQVRPAVTGFDFETGEAMGDQVTPYQNDKTLTLTFNNRGVKDNGDDDNVVIDGLSTGDYEHSYNTQDSTLVITFKTNLAFETEYTVNLYNIKSAEPKSNVTESTSISFTTVDTPNIIYRPQRSRPRNNSEEQSPYLETLRIAYNRPVKEGDEISLSTSKLGNFTRNDDNGFYVGNNGNFIELDMRRDFAYNDTVTVILPNVMGNEDIEFNSGRTDTLTFRTEAPTPPTISSIVDVSGQSIANRGITPYRQTFTITFENRGVMDNGNSDRVRISGVPDNSISELSYDDGQMSFNILEPLDFGETYQVELFNIRSNENADNVADSLDFTFTVTNEAPSIANVVGSGQRICANTDSEIIGFNILEGHPANFHQSESPEDFFLSIRKQGSDSPSTKFIFSSPSDFTIGNAPTDLAGVNSARIISDYRRHRFWYNSARGVGAEYRDLLNVMGFKVKYDEDEVANGDGGTYEIYISSSKTPFRGLPEVIATVVLEGKDNAPTLVRSDSRSGDNSNICDGEEITFSVQGADSTDNYRYYLNTQLVETGFSYTTSDLEQDDVVYATTVSTCPTNSNEIPINVIGIDGREIMFTATYKDANRNPVDSIGFRSVVPMGNMTDSLILTAQYVDNGSLVDINGTFYDSYNALEPPLLFYDSVNNNYRWSPVNAWLNNPNPAVYDVYFQQQCALRGEENAAGFNIRVYDQTNAKQLSSDAITNGTICDNLDSAVSIEWIPALVLEETVKRYSMSSETNGLIISDSSGYYIRPSAAAGENFVNIDIEYVINGDSLETVKEIRQALTVALPARVNIIDAETGEWLKSAYCSNHPLVTLDLSSPDLPNLDVYSVKNLDSANAAFLPLASNILRFDSIPNTERNLDAANYLYPNVNGFAIKVDYRTTDNCTSSTDTVVFVNPLPPAIAPQYVPSCLGTGTNGYIDPIDFTPTNLDSANNYSLIWSVDNIERANSWVFNSQISDTRVGTSTLNVQLVDSLTGCVSEKSNVIVEVGELPRADYQYFISSDQKLWLKDLSTSSDSIALWNWEAKGNEVQQFRIGTNTEEYDTLQLFKSGIDTLSLVVTTQLGCSDTAERVITMPAYADQSNDSYTTTFEGQHDWIATTQNENTSSEAARNSTWELKLYKGLTSAWHAAGNNEYSWVESPLIDISQWPSPVLSMDLNYHTPELEGVVIQYRLVGKKPTENSGWRIVGSTETGAIPYNSSGISAAVGGGITGWTGVSDGFYQGWIRPAFDLSSVRVAAREAAEAAGRSKDQALYVQFRVAYATLDIAQGDERVGVAFDNFVIGNKSRGVLVEHYTNLNFPEIQDARKEVDQFVMDRQSIDAPDVIYIQYHPPSDKPDALNTRYYSGQLVGNLGHNTRGLLPVGHTYMNLGRYSPSEFPNALDQYHRQTVQAPIFDIDLSYNENYQAGDYLEINAKAVRNNIPYLTLDTASREYSVVLSAAIVEKEIEINGDIHHNVLVEIIPPYGTCSKRTNWSSEVGDSLVMENVRWQIPVDAEPDTYAIIAWVERSSANPYPTDKNPREVFQAKQLDIGISLVASDPVTSVQTLSSQGVVYYPVPVKNELRLKLHALHELHKQRIQWSILTLTNQSVLTGSWTTSNDEQVIHTQRLPSGMYLLQIEGYDKPIRISKE